MKRKFIAVLTIVLCLFLVACGSQSTSSTDEVTSEEETTTQEEYSGEVTVYTSVPQDLADQFKIKFEEKYPDVTVNIYRATSGEVLTKIKTEAEGGQLSGDVLWVADFASAESLKELNLLDKYDSEEAKILMKLLKIQKDIIMVHVLLIWC